MLMIIFIILKRLTMFQTNAHVFSTNFAFTLHVQLLLNNVRSIIKYFYKPFVCSFNVNIYFIRGILKDMFKMNIHINCYERGYELR